MYVLDIGLKCDFYKFYFAASAYPDEEKVIRRESLSANKISLIISIPLWDSIKFIQHLYHHTRHRWQKSKGLSVRILRVMPHRNFKKLRVRWMYYD